MKKIALIYMGGTFGCIGEPLAPMNAEAFLPQLKHVLPLDLEIECFIAPVIKDSSACHAADWLALIQQIQNLIKANYQHFVVIHGTDTLSYASAVLSRFLAQQACIILTGSQYPLLTADGTNTRDFSDALPNLNLALRTVTEAAFGVYLAFHQQVIHAASALKRHTTELDAFSGIQAEYSLIPTTPYLIDDVLINKAKGFNCVSLMMQPLSLDQQLKNLKIFLNQPPHALILQGFGTANLSVNDDMIDILHKLYHKGCAIILTTQVPFGDIEQHYAINSWLSSAPVCISNCMGHADLYAKTLKMYLQYTDVEQWYDHWQDQ